MEPPMATALSTVSSAPIVRDRPKTTRSDPWRAGVENQIEHLAGRALRDLDAERASGRALRRGDHQAPARLLGDRTQRVENRPSRLGEGDDGRVVRQSALQPTAIRRGRPGEAGQTQESDGENDDQLGYAHVRSPFAREYGRACRLFHEPERSRPRDEDQ